MLRRRRGRETVYHCGPLGPSSLPLRHLPVQGEAYFASTPGVSERRQGGDGGSRQSPVQRERMKCFTYSAAAAEAAVTAKGRGGSSKRTYWRKTMTSRNDYYATRRRNLHPSLATPLLSAAAPRERQGRSSGGSEGSVTTVAAPPAKRPASSSILLLPRRCQNLTSPSSDHNFFHRSFVRTGSM